MNHISNICICGGGSLGLVCAGVFLSKGITVNILTGHPEKWRKNISVFDGNGKMYSGQLGNISSDPEKVIPEADMVFLTLPGFIIEEVLTKIKPWLNNRTIVGSVVSSTGFFFAAHEILNKETCLFGFQRVPYIARQREYGSIGDLLGYKSSLNVVIENSDSPESIVSELKWLFGTDINLLNNFYEVSLSNSNPILHTGRLYAMWKDYNGETYPRCTNFYAEWNDESSEYLIRMDEEFHLLLEKIGLEVNSIPTLLEYYQSKDARSLTNKIKSIPAFKTIQSPMRQVESGWIPDFNSRYFTEDFPYGLRFIHDLAHKYNLFVPTIDQVYSWGISKINQELIERERLS